MINKNKSKKRGMAILKTARAVHLTDATWQVRAAGRESHTVASKTLGNRQVRQVMHGKEIYLITLMYKKDVIFTRQIGKNLELWNWTLAGQLEAAEEMKAALPSPKSAEELLSEAAPGNSPQKKGRDGDEGSEGCSRLFGTVLGSVCTQT